MFNVDSTDEDFIFGGPHLDIANQTSCPNTTLSDEVLDYHSRVLHFHSDWEVAIDNLHFIFIAMLYSDEHVPDMGYDCSNKSSGLLPIDMSGYNQLIAFHFDSGLRLWKGPFK
jgi:hypothetical protein